MVQYGFSLDFLVPGEDLYLPLIKIEKKTVDYKYSRI